MSPTGWQRAEWEGEGCCVLILLELYSGNSLLVLLSVC